MTIRTKAYQSVFEEEAARLVAAANDGVSRGGALGAGVLDAVTEQRLNRIDPKSPEQRRRNERAVVRVLRDIERGPIDAPGISARIITDAAIQQHAAETMKMHKAIKAGRPFEPQSGYPRFAVWKASGERLETMSMKPETIDCVYKIAEGRFEEIPADAALARQIASHLEKAQSVSKWREGSEAAKSGQISGFAAAVSKIRSMLKGPSSAEPAYEASVASRISFER